MDIQTESTPEELNKQPFKDMIFLEILPHIHILIVDVFGNYVIQKLIEFGSDRIRATIADQVMG